MINLEQNDLIKAVKLGKIINSVRDYAFVSEIIRSFNRTFNDVIYFFAIPEGIVIKSKSLIVYDKNIGVYTLSTIKTPIFTIAGDLHVQPMVKSYRARSLLNRLKAIDKP